MRYLPARGSLLERYEVEDGVMLGIANEHGDITAYVERPDGTRGHAYGGPVYDPPEFANVCERVEQDRAAGHGWHRTECICPHDTDLTAAEKAVADALARKVGWMA
jgi:hypothetical protein